MSQFKEQTLVRVLQPPVPDPSHGTTRRRRRCSRRAGPAASPRLHPSPGLLQTGSKSQGRILSSAETGQSCLPVPAVPATAQLGTGWVSDTPTQASLASAGRDAAATFHARSNEPPPAAVLFSFSFFFFLLLLTLYSLWLLSGFNISPRLNPSLPSCLQLPRCHFFPCAWERPQNHQREAELMAGRINKPQHIPCLSYSCFKRRNTTHSHDKCLCLAHKWNS